MNESLGIAVATTGLLITAVGGGWRKRCVLSVASQTHGPPSNGFGTECRIRVCAVAIGMGCGRDDWDIDPSAGVSPQRWRSDVGTSCAALACGADDRASLVFAMASEATSK